MSFNSLSSMVELKVSHELEFFSALSIFKYNPGKTNNKFITS